MADIKFVPSCSNCGRLIFDQICCEEIPDYPDTSRYIFKKYQITPKYCMACGEPFEQIVFYPPKIIKFDS